MLLNQTDGQPYFTEPCKNKPCIRRNDMEEKLLARREKIKLELERKVKRFHSLQRSVRLSREQNTNDKGTIDNQVPPDSMHATGILSFASIDGLFPRMFMAGFFV